MSNETRSLRIRPPRLALGLAVSLYLYFGLGATAVVFYELYHLIGIEFIYYLYSAFKAASYYFPRWDYQWLLCTVIGMMVALPWWRALKTKLRRRV